MLSFILPNTQPWCFYCYLSINQIAQKLSKNLLGNVKYWALKAKFPEKKYLQLR